METLSNPSSCTVGEVVGLISEGSQCGGTVGRVPFLGTLDGMLRKNLDTGIPLHRGPFMYRGNLESGV